MFDRIYTLFKDMFLFCVNFHIPKESIGSPIDIYPFWLCVAVFLIILIIDFCFPDKED